MSSKRTVLITGCSDGSLGSSLALAFHKANWRVIATARNLKKLSVVEAAGIEILSLDITVEESIIAAVHQVKEMTGGSLDALVNNAGAGAKLPLLDSNIDEVRKLFDLNVYPILTVTRAFFPLLVRSTKKPMVINNTSVLGLTTSAFPWHGSYCASKAAAASITETLRLELAPFGIRAINLVTGLVRSHFHDNVKPTLPPDSYYNAAKADIEDKMTGDDMDGEGMDTTVWANAVVKDVSSSSPPHWVFRGKTASLARYIALLPIGMGDYVIKQMSRVDIFEKKFKDQGGISKLELPY